MHDHQQSALNTLNPWFKVVVSLVIAGTLLACIIVWAPGEFWVNDDTIMQAILSGSTSGEPTPYAVFVNIIVGFLISGLFSTFPSIPWWFAFLQTGMFFAIATFSYASMTLLDCVQQGKLGRALPVFITFAASLCFFLYFIYYPSFTFTATSLASASIACYLTVTLCPNLQASERRGLSIAVVLLMLVSCWVRFDCGVIGIAFITCSGVLTELRHSHIHKGLAKDHAARTLLPIVLIMVLVAMSWGANKVAYSTDEWKEFQEVNNARSTYMDFHHYSYDEQPALYEAEGWNENLYSLVTSWFFMDERVDKGAFESLAGEAEPRALRSLVSNFTYGTGMFSHSLSLAFIAVIIAQSALVIALGRFRWPSVLVLVADGAALIGCLFLWLISRAFMHAVLSVLVPASVFCWILILLLRWKVSKPPSKVLLICVIVYVVIIIVMLFVITPRYSDIRYRYFLIALVPSIMLLICWLRARKGAEECRHIVVTGLIVMCMTLCIGAYGEIQKDHASGSILANRTADLREYATSHPDDFFVFYNGLYSNNAIAMTPENTVSWGGWEYFAPWRKIVASKIGHPEGLYIDILLDDDTYFMTYGEKYADNLKTLLAERTGQSIEYELVAKMNSGTEIYKYSLANEA